MANEGGWRSQLRGVVENAVLGDVKEQLEEANDYNRLLMREYERLRYDVLNAAPEDQDLNIQDRLKFVREARRIWQVDPQAGAAVDLMNDFTLGSGLSRPRAKDKLVQEEIDEAWDDPDNQLVLTTYVAQVALGTDLSLQSNVYLLMFSDDDGKVKLGLLDHDTVENVVRDPENRLRILYYVTRERRYGWDFANDRPARVTPGAPQSSNGNGSDRSPPTVKGGTRAPKGQIVYYAHWQNVKDKEASNEKFDKPPKDKLGDGVVYHMAINRTSEMAFGAPTMRRLTKWFSAYNEFLGARVDVAKAAASFIMKRVVKGGPAAVAQQSAKQLSRRSPLAAQQQDPAYMDPPRAGSVLNENEAVTHSALNLSSNAGNATQDASMLRGPIAAGTRFPEHYMGGSGPNLATATAMELPVLKGVEARQEVIEQMVRWFIDRVIEKAVEGGRIPQALDDTELQEAYEQQQLQVREACGRIAPEVDEDREAYTVRIRTIYRDAMNRLQEAHEDKGQDEADTARDLSYEFQMPNPLRRMMGELIGAVTNVAKTFDPNGTNMELSRELLTMALGGMEVEDPAAVVERIFPPGYVDPAVAAFQQQAAGGEAPVELPPEAEQLALPDGAPGADGKRHKEENPYGAKQKATLPEDVQEAIDVDVEEFETQLDFLGEAFDEEVGAAFAEVVVGME